MDDPSLSHNPTFVPYSCSFDLKTMVNEDGASIGLVINFKMGDGESDPTFRFLVEPDGWYKLALEMLVSIGTHYPGLRPKVWVDAPWLTEHTP